MMKQDVLFEIGCEELPSHSVYPLGQALCEQIQAGFLEKGVAFASVHFFATPRRLAVYVTQVPDYLPEKKITKKGPAKAVSHDECGAPLPALIGFAKSCGVTVEALQCEETDKGSWYVFEKSLPQEKVVEILPDIITQALTRLPIPKPMHWGNQVGPFVRPVHWVILMYGSMVVPATFFGKEASNQTFGHRFHYPEAYALTHPSEYESLLLSLKVIPDFEKRKEIIASQIFSEAKHKHAQPILPSELLDEITSIVEWPVALVCEFDPLFLRLPREALIASMQVHQKCVALEASDHQLLPYFITVSNIESKEKNQVIKGNEKVMTARLSDAHFFYTQDRKKPLLDFFPQLEHTLLQLKLGTLADQTRRMEKVLVELASCLKTDTTNLHLLAKLSKCDLMTGMVGEFPELEGIAGYYYALEDGYAPELALALKEQYLPRFSQDCLPSSLLGTLLSLVGRLDTLVGIFGIGQKPSGVKDPYKLRRHALAVVRLLATIPIRLELTHCLKIVAKTFESDCLEHLVIEELKLFILERLPAYYQSEGLDHTMVPSVLAVQSEWIFDQVERVKALTAQASDLTSLLAGVKRVSQFLKTVDRESLPQKIDESYFEMDAEKSLFQSVNVTQQNLSGLSQKQNYHFVLHELNALTPQIDSFFENVLVMVDDQSVRANRLLLLFQLQDLFLNIADLSLISK